MISATDPLDIDNIITSLHKKIEPFTSRGSGWNVSKIQNLSLCNGSFHPTAGSSFIPTRAEIKKKMAIINVRNHNSNNCFQYSVLEAVHPATSNLSNPYTYNKFMKELDMTGIETPVALSSIPKFESQNSSISINVLVCEEKELIPVYTSKFCNQRPHYVNLLLLSKGDKFHYTLVTSLSRLVGNKTRHDGKIFVCPYCLHYFWKEHCLQNHLTECSQHPAQTVTYPEKGKNILKFDKVQHMFPVPFALYADFESFITPYREHVHTGFCCLRVSKFPQYDHKIHTYSGDNVVQEFLKYVTQ